MNSFDSRSYIYIYAKIEVDIKKELHEKIQF